MGDTKDTIKQLNAARDIVLKDAAIYPQVVPGVLPVISAERPVELRRWGADFLAETFASPVVNAEDKQKMALVVLDTLKSYLSRKEETGEEEEDWTVVKSAIQCAASIYPLVFRHTISNATDSETWAKMAGIKSGILRRMDSAPGSVRICCIKFVARVVEVHTPGLIADPRRPEQNEISLALVPRDHKVMPPSNLEAEASGLLDRLLGVLQDNTSDPLIITATLNSISSLVQRRASISTKILSTVLSFNPLKLASTDMDGKDKVAVKSMTRTTMSFLLNVLKRNPGHALAGRIQQQVERLRQSLMEVFSDQNPLKRPAPDEPIDGFSADKRQRLDREAEAGSTPLQQDYPPLPSGPVSVAQLFTLTNDTRAAGFHVEAIPQQFVAQLVPHMLTAIDQARFDTAISVVRARFLEVQRRPPPSAALPGDEEDEDYDPSTGFGDSEQIANQIDQLPPLRGQPELALATFHLPPPPPLSEERRIEYSETAKGRLFGALQKLDDEARQKGKKEAVDGQKGFNRLAAADGLDRDGWIALLSRLATRPTFSLDDEDSKVKQEGEDRSIVKKSQFVDLPNMIREAFHKYIMDDWRRRIDVAIAWLNEEWYADHLLAKQLGDANSSDEEALPNYIHHTLRLLDFLIPYLDIKDGRYLIRFLSEIPYIPHGVFERIQKIALDPERVQLCTQALLYLIMLKPPARSGAIDCAEEMWRTNSDAMAAAAKILTKWRPGVLEGGEGVKQEG